LSHYLKFVTQLKNKGWSRQVAKRWEDIGRNHKILKHAQENKNPDKCCGYFEITEGYFAAGKGL
jgi:hypothetical protein